jgi:hypothetical protein
MVSGTITAELSGLLLLDGSTISITFNDFTVDTVGLSGSLALALQDVRVLSEGTAGLSTSISELQFIFPRSTYSLDANLTLTWLLNVLSDFQDDDFAIPALTMRATKLGGPDFDVSLIEDLLLESDCKEIVTGIIDLQEASTPFPASINFGDGTCDGVADVTTTLVFEIGGIEFTEMITYQIDLP